MGKENALGSDPLNRTRSPNENRKSPLLDAMVTTNPQGDKNAQQTNVPGPFRRPEPLAINKETPAGSPRAPQAPVRMAGHVDPAAAQKPKVVIGRLYEKPTPEREKPFPRAEDARQEARPMPESTTAPRSFSPMMGTPMPEANRKDSTISPSKFSNYLIIVYTAIMLILGYIAYRDVSKRISKIESKILAIEKAINY
ncbi:MAG: hypothetical protein AAB332_03500 [Planctomycetota bacterium]